MKIEFQDRVWQVDVDNLTLTQAVVITGKMGGSLADWESSLEDPRSDGWLPALACLYWLMLQQDGERIAIGDVDFAVLQYSRAVAAAIEREGAEVPAEPEDPILPAVSPAEAVTRSPVPGTG